jgi:hypothetical protein
MTESPSDPARLLRISLRANAVFSSLSGATFCVAGAAIADLLGVEPALLVNVVGLNLLVFAGVLLFVASRRMISPPIANAIILADLAWVAGSLLLVLADVFHPSGAIAVLFVANIVLAFAVIQFIGVRRLVGAGAAI